jgi:hypothetical protein
MVTFRIVVPSYNGKRIVGDWQRDVPHYIVEFCKIWIAREVSFTVEFKGD